MTPANALAEPTASVEVRRAYRFRLYPTEVQAAELAEWERQLRRLYNLAHEQRLAALARSPGERPGDASMQRGHDARDRAAVAARAWRAEAARGESAAARTHLRRAREELAASKAAFEEGRKLRVTYFRQAREMTELIRDDPQLARVVCCARQEVLRDLERAWQRFFKRKGGRPRFKRRTDSVHIYFSSVRDWKVADGKLAFGGMAASVGPIEMAQDQPWPGDPMPGRLTDARKAKLAKRPRRSAPKFSSCHITRDVDQWYAVFSLAFSEEVDKPTGEVVGINRGAIHALADSTGRVVDSPRYYECALDRIRKRSRDLERKSPRHKPRPTRFRRLHEDRGAAIKLAHRLGTSVGNLVYQTKKRGGVEAAIAWIEAHPPAPKLPAADGAVGVHLGRRRWRAAKRLAIAHRTVRRQRQAWLHEQSAHYARRYTLIGIEDWSTKKIVADPKVEEKHHYSKTCKRHGCDDPVVKRRLCRKHYDEERFIPKRAVHRSILDVGWSEFARQCIYKSEPAGGRVVAVPSGIEDAAAFDDPTRGGISKTCSACGASLDRSASGHVAMVCARCGHAELGDVNAAENVLARALRAVAPEPKTRTAIAIKGRKRKRTA